MKTTILFGSLLALMIWTGSKPLPAHKQPLSPSYSIEKEPVRFAFLGGTLISRMEKYGYLEQAITTALTGQEPTFRNLGWPGDDVFGNARSEFGSAHNTRSWRPPDAEEGFGYEVLMQQVKDAHPGTLVIAYGAELAYAGNEKAFADFEKGYEALLKAFRDQGIKLILLSPTRQQKVQASSAHDLAERNQRLAKAAQLIRNLANRFEAQFIDLFEKLIPAGSTETLTENGLHLTERGYKKMSELIYQEMAFPTQTFEISLHKKGELLASQGAKADNFKTTNRGFRFDVLPEHLNPHGKLLLEDAHLLKINGEVHRVRSREPEFTSKPDSILLGKLRQLIIEKNRLHRYRINPLNKAYIFLFRRHEMGHLAYEMDDFDRLVEEKEELIARLRLPQTRRYEIELLAPWKSPRQYPDHEVPQNIPAPNIAAELAAFTLAEGFAINLFAADPMIANPIHVNWDTRGRAWVATSSTYPHIVPGQEPNDKIVILEDSNHDGVADKHTVFAEGLLIPHSVMPVKGGAYVTCSTELLFLADTNGDDVADERRIVYSGFGNADVHHMIHGLRWAPWGDLYFTQSIYINSFVETPFGTRVLNGSGIWQFRPETERLEVFARGMINPWGHAFDPYGQAFGTDGAGGAGPHYVYPGSAHPSAVGSARVLNGLIRGKPKNTAAEFVSGRHLSAHWQGSLLANDYRANRTVRYELTEKGSGYSAEEVETIIHSSHRSYRPVDMKMGPDGALYIVDWYNPIIDHGEVDFHHPSRDKSHGRIWRLTSQNKALVKPPKIYGASTKDLLALLKAPEEYTRIQANRELVRQGCSAPAIKKWLKKLAITDPAYDHHRLEALWLGAALNQPDLDLLEELLQVEDHHVRAAAVRMLGFWKEQNPLQKSLTQLVRDPHPQVRLEALHVLRSLGSSEAADLALSVLDLPMDTDLEFALWLTAKELQPAWMARLKAGKKVFADKPDRLLFALQAANNQAAAEQMGVLVKKNKLSPPQKQQAYLLMAAQGGQKELDKVLREAANGDEKLLQALVSAPSGNAAVPKRTSVIGKLLVHTDPQIRTLGAQLASRWQLTSMRDLLIQQLSGSQAGKDEQLASAQALARLGDYAQLQKLSTSHDNPSVQSAAFSAWAAAQPREAARDGVELLARLSSVEDAALIFKSYVNQEGGPALLEKELAGRQLPEAIGIEGIRIAQTSGQQMEGLVKALGKAASLKPVGAKLTSEQRKALLQEIDEKGDAKRGRQIYIRPQLLCTTCHVINDDGGKLGPDLTSVGAYMTPSSLLESLINPGSDIKQGYETVIIVRKDGKTLSGTLERKSDTGALIRQMSGEVIEIANEDIQKLDTSPVSLMPPGLTASLRADELLDLMKYLSSLGKE